MLRKFRYIMFVLGIRLCDKVPFNGCGILHPYSFDTTGLSHEWMQKWDNRLW